MNLGGLLQGVKVRVALSNEQAAREVAGIDYDSRRSGEGFVFFAFAGSRVDGRRFAEDAVARGAFAIVSELPPPSAAFTSRWIEVEHGRRALATAARNFYGQPDTRVRFTGITGTNGKTTTSYLIDAVLREAGYVTGLIGTIETRVAGQRREAVNTTPESLDVMRIANELEQKHVEKPAITMEVSSHALALGRVFGIRFHTAVFTNLTRDHLDFHRTMEEYAAAKRLLFHPQDSAAPEWSIMNADDPASATMKPVGRVVTYGFDPSADLRAENVESSFSGLRFDLTYRDSRQAVTSSLVGHINVSNILAAAGVGISYGIDLATISRGIAACTAVPGRFERIDEGQPFLVAVDYAHTDDALRNLIQVARGLTKGRVITLFGCGGDRDRTKRPLMGMAAGELSDFVVLTSDNPRSEDPLAIINDALVGLGRFDTPHVIEPDRAKAIRIAIEHAGPGDVVLLAGKGHETYQVQKDRTIHFDDRETAREVLRSIKHREPRQE